jgi:parallel beta-helix repeat protein
MRSNRSWHPKGSIMHTWKHAHAGLAICLLALAVVSPLQAGTVYVSTTGDDANGGLSWATAKKTVQAGLNAAVAGDQVWVAAGIYVEKIALKSGVALYGGFAGTETELAQRDFVAHATVLDANRSGSAVFVPTGTTGAPRIDGFTLRNSAGQGIDCRSGPVTIANNLITANSSGGIYCNGSSIVIVGNTIKGNSGSSGGGITCYNCSPTIVGNVILGNSADSGGGIYCYKSSSIITNNTIAGNSAATCGGIYCSNSSPTITNTIVAFNSSGIRVYNGGSPALANNCFYGNELYDYSGLTDPTGTAGNVSVDPLLADGAYGNIHLQPGSPCIDAGNDAAVQPGWLDMDRQARTMGLHVDIGADEADGTTWPAGPYVIVRVSPAGSDANDGSSWALAKRTVQAAIDAAAVAGGDVWAAEGTYVERIMLWPYAYLYGGFTGSEAQRSERDWSAHRAALDGSGGGLVVAIDAGWRVSTIDGFVIRNGSSGGIRCRRCAATIANNTITANTTTNFGAGISCDGGSCPVIVNNTITANRVTSAYGAGGGIYCNNARPVITNNTIAGNITPDGGGGIYVYASEGSVGAIITNTLVTLNSSGIRLSSGLLSLRHNCVYDNGGADYDGVTDPTGIDGNISLDPRLVGIGWHDVHIQPDSPCVDAGDDGVVLPEWRDMDAQARIAGAHVDIGSDESDGTVRPPVPNMVIRVSSAGDDSNDGSSWALAKRTVQGVLAAAAPGDQVWVAAGTHVGNFALREGIALYGGFAGTESDPSQRSGTAHRTVLDGARAGSVVTILPGAPGSPAEATWIDGFTIRNGVTSNDGAGIYCPGAATIVNNVIAGNLSGRNGGGVYCGGAAMLAGNTFLVNKAARGAGVYCAPSASPTIASSTIVGNNASEGGGVYCDSSSPIIANTIVAFNSTGIYSTASGTPSLRYNCVYENTAYNYSGLADPTGTDGNLSADPRLAALPYGNVHIQPDSPCVDAGDDAVVQAGWRDMDGGLRVLGARVDIGADESDGTAWSGEPNVIVRVSLAGNDANDGSSWALAKRTVQAGINAAADAGGDVWVAEGAYVELVTLRNFVHLYGGFAGQETQRGERDWAGRPTILDGNQGGPTVYIADTGPGMATIDGFGIRNGTSSNGGGITCYSSSPAIRNNTITGNDGGGIYCDRSSPTIENNTISGNSKTKTGDNYINGGGIYCSGGLPTIVGNTISGNTATLSYGHGGGIYCGSFRLITRNTITGNASASYGGAIYCGGGTIEHNTITGNSGGDTGGIYCTGAVTVAHNTIGANTGIGVRCTAGATVANNKVSTNGSHGISCSGPASTITNNLVTGNNGSGISCGTATLINNTITGNSGGGISCTSATTIVNTLVAFNAQGITNSSSSGPPSLRHNCVFGNPAHDFSGLPDPTGTDGNISVDPVLASVPYNNLHIQPTSPCVDAGDDTAIQPDWLDMDGQARVLGSGVDIGADESDGTTWSAVPLAVVRVSPAGNDANNGSTWALAKRTVQAGIDAAAPSGGGEVWVAAGTYVERITLRNCAHVFGGFAGTETQRDQRDWLVNVTALDGNKGGSVVTANQPGFAPSTLDGFVVRNGNGTLVSSRRYGGGIYCANASPVIRNSTITANSAYDGGGIYCMSAGPVISDCTISGNAASHYGGGSHLDSSGSSAATIRDCTITGNSAPYGGGISCYRCSPTIAGNTIASNTGSAEGGGIYCYRAGGRITGNTIRDNNSTRTDSLGGGIACNSSSPRVEGNTIANNAADYGGGISCLEYWSSALPWIVRNTITGNTATSAGGGIYSGDDCLPKIVSNTIAGNRAGYAGGIWCGRGPATVAGNAITGNQAQFGGGLFCDGGSTTSSPRILNNTLTANDAFYGGAICCQNTAATIANTIVAFNTSGIQVFGTAALSLRHNCVYDNGAYDYAGLADPTGTDGNRSAAPLLLRPADPGQDGTWGTADDNYGELRLLPGSPCIDAGNNADVPADAVDLDADGNTTEPLPLDVAGTQRFADDPHTPDTGAGTAPIVDIGACEYRCADVNGDGLVDVVDLLYVVEAFDTSGGQADYDPRCDFNADGTVDVADLLDLVYNFGL